MTELNATLAAKAAEFEDIIKIGRTHLMDAVPMTMGGLDAFARQVANGIARIEDTLPRLLRFRRWNGGRHRAQRSGGFDIACEQVSLLSAVDFSPNPSKFEGMAAHDALVEVSGALNVVAISPSRSLTTSVSSALVHAVSW